VLDLVVVTFSKPAPFLGWIGESGEYAFGRSGIAAFDDERAVNYGLLFHSVTFLSTRDFC